MSHKDLYFEIDDAPSRELFRQPLLRRVDQAGMLLAGSAIRAHIEVSRQGSRDIPGLAVGRIHCPRSMVQEWNALPLEGNPQPSVLTIVEDPHYSTTYWCQIFTDRTVLIMTPEDESIGQTGIPLMRTLPIILRLPEKTRIADSENMDLPWTIHIRDGKDATEFMVSPTGKLDDAKNYFEWTPSGYMEKLKLTALRSAFEAEVVAWGRQIPQLPWIAHVNGAPISGRLGQEIPAPDPRLEGLPYAWPAAAPYIGLTMEKFREVESFMKLAWAWFTDTFCGQIPDGVIEVWAATPSQYDTATRIKVSTQMLPAPGEARTRTEARALAEFRRLMTHPAAPEGLNRITATTTIDTNKAGTRQKLGACILFQARITNDRPSAHERLQAHALFKPWEDTQ